MLLRLKVFTKIDRLYLKKVLSLILSMIHKKCNKDNHKFLFLIIRIDNTNRWLLSKFKWLQKCLLILNIFNFLNNSQYCLSSKKFQSIIITIKTYLIMTLDYNKILIKILKNKMSLKILNKLLNSLVFHLPPLVVFMLMEFLLMLLIEK